MPRPKQQRQAVNSATCGTTPVIQPTQAEIARRAHEIYRARGGAAGCDLDDWLKAERELKAETGQPLTSAKNP
jgi:hypothetical protein